MDCADAKCKPDEVAIANDGQGDSFRGCACMLFSVNRQIGY